MLDDGKGARYGAFRGRRFVEQREHQVGVDSSLVGQKGGAKILDWQCGASIFQRGDGHFKKLACAAPIALGVCDPPTRVQNLQRQLRVEQRRIRRSCGHQPALGQVDQPCLRDIPVLQGDVQCQQRRFAAGAYIPSQRRLRLRLSCLRQERIEQRRSGVERTSARPRPLPPRVRG